MDKFENGKSLENLLLSALPKEDFQRLVPHLKVVQLSKGEILYEPFDPIEEVYFPNDAVISQFFITKDGETIEVGVIGYEGMLGISISLGNNSTPYRSCVQIAGSAIKMPVDILKEEILKCSSLQRIIADYTHALLIQISQLGICNRFHIVEKRLCRWLLIIHDRVKTDTLFLTQDILSQMLGTRRASVSDAMRNLRRQELISYSYGQVTIIDRLRLESKACECYKIIKREFDRFLVKHDE